MAYDKDTEIIKAVEKDVCKVKKVPLKFIRFMGNYNMYPRKLQVSHMFMDEIAVHFYRNRLNLSGNLER